jgi:hypothetical protein
MLNEWINLTKHVGGKSFWDLSLGFGHFTWTKIAFCEARVAILATEGWARTAIAPFKGSFVVHDLIF